MSFYSDKINEIIAKEYDIIADKVALVQTYCVMHNIDTKNYSSDDYLAMYEFMYNRAIKGKVIEQYGKEISSNFI